MSLLPTSPGKSLLKKWKSNCWEWEAGTVRVIQLPTEFHVIAISAIARKICEQPDGLFRPVDLTEEYEELTSFPDDQPWEVANTASEAYIRNKVEDYWLRPGRVHYEFGAVDSGGTYSALSTFN
ncbi:2636_t:CDS:2 [Paraglomus brasilianum]|uniref:2636_t:CDS:1 n=1 Tax=Paraglomus brasilianum TaxID=144538 RepID=A0A9N9GAF0_9GLOM|nr:2636_t:CDS:2 [Paraglomus brasilianum]